MTHHIKDCLNVLKQEKLDAFLVTDDVNISYLTGCDSRDSWLLITPKDRFYITDFRYLAEAKKQLKDFTIAKINGSVFKLVAELTKKAGAKRLGFESKNLSFAEYDNINKSLSGEGGIEFVSTFDLVESLREIKTEEEIRNIRKAIKINIDGFKILKKVIKPGVRELDIAIKLDNFIRQKDAVFAFDPIVASGSNSAFPHAIVSGRKLKADEPVLVDFGVKFQGYRSDLTRVFFLGRISLHFNKLYKEVLAAQESAIKKVAAGVRICEIDECARNFLNKKQLGKFFGHALGHGIGRQTHENPSISPKNQEKLKKNMVFTVEPAIYLEGEFGIRIEDMVLVNSNGCEVLSDDLDKSIKNWSYNSN